MAYVFRPRGMTCVAALMLLACNKPNPAFDPDHGEAGTGDPTGDGDPTTDPGDGDPETGTAEGDGDPTGDGDGDPVPDMPVEYCELPLRASLEPTFINPTHLGQACPMAGESWIRVHSTTGLYWDVSLCPNGCGVCDGEPAHPLGAPGLSLPMILTPMLVEPNNPYSGCYYVEYEGLAWDEPDRCVYESLSIFGDSWPQYPPIFVATQRGAPPTPSANAYLNWVTNLSETGSCPCADMDPNFVECCGEDTVVTYDFIVGDANDTISPPGQAMVVLGNNLNYTLFAMQAQSGASCEAPDEISFALRMPQG